MTKKDKMRKQDKSFSLPKYNSICIKTVASSAIGYALGAITILSIARDTISKNEHRANEMVCQMLSDALASKDIQRENIILRGKNVQLEEALNKIRKEFFNYKLPKCKSISDDICVSIKSGFNVLSGIAENASTICKDILSSADNALGGKRRNNSA